MSSSTKKPRPSPTTEAAPNDTRERVFAVAPGSKEAIYRYNLLYRAWTQVTQTVDLYEHCDHVEAQLVMAMHTIRSMSGDLARENLLHNLTTILIAVSELRGTANGFARDILEEEGLGDGDLVDGNLPNHPAPRLGIAWCNRKEPVDEAYKLAYPAMAAAAEKATVKP